MPCSTPPKPAKQTVTVAGGRSCSQLATAANASDARGSEIDLCAPMQHGIAAADTIRNPAHFLLCPPVMPIRSLLAVVVLTCFALTTPPCCSLVDAQDSKATGEQADGDTVLAGHSFHGEAFNQGPRQAAVLIPGMAEDRISNIDRNRIRPSSFVNQGVAQLHGFWYLEAERSFRQAAKEDPDLAIAYWGMAMANVNNDDRARGLIDEAMKRRNKGADRREKMYIEALNRFIPQIKKEPDKAAADQAQKSKTKAEKEAQREAKQKRVERYIADLEKLLHEYPEDLEAKAFLALQLWTGDRAGVKLTSRYAVNALLGEVFVEQPHASGSSLPNSFVGFTETRKLA